MTRREMWRREIFIKHEILKIDYIVDAILSFPQTKWFLQTVKVCPFQSGDTIMSWWITFN